MLKELSPHIIPTLPFLLSIAIFLFGRSDKKEDKKEKRMKEAREQHKEGEGLPPRRHTHL